MSWLKKVFGEGAAKAAPTVSNSDHWGFYSLRVDDEPASIFLDMGIADRAPVAAYGQRAYLRLEMREPTENGLSSAAEFDDLAALEDAVTTEIIAACPGIYVGRNTSGGHRDLYFYVGDGDLFEPAARAAMAAYPDYRFEVGVRSDPAWDVYFNFLYPSPASRQQMGDTALLAQLAKHGDRSDQSRKIDHMAWFADETARAAFAALIAAKGYAIEKDQPEPSDGQVGLEFSHVGAPNDMYDVSRELHDLAAKNGGEYDGWACGVVN